MSPCAIPQRGGVPMESYLALMIVSDTAAIRGRVPENLQPNSTPSKGTRGHFPGRPLPWPLFPPP